MSQRKIESLSAFIDGDDDGNFLEELRNDAELINKWQRYHIIRDGLKNELPVELNLDLSDKIAEALENEPTIMAPKPSRFRGWFGKVANDKGPIGKGLSPALQQTGHFAIAASVAVAVILGYQQFNQPVAVQPFSGAPTIPVTGIQGGLSPVSFEQTRTLPRTDVAEQRRRLNAYLNDHNQQVRRKSNVDTSIGSATEQTPKSKKNQDSQDPESK